MAFCRSHDNAVWAFGIALRFQRQFTATEVGVPGGRVDIVTYTDWTGDEPECAFEVKTSLAGLLKGPKQLAGYASFLGAKRAILAVDEQVATRGVEAAAAEYGIEYWVVDFPMLIATVDELREDDRWRKWMRYRIDKPYLWHETRDRVASYLADLYRERVAA